MQKIIDSVLGMLKEGMTCISVSVLFVIGQPLKAVFWMVTVCAFIEDKVRVGLDKDRYVRHGSKWFHRIDFKGHKRVALRLLTNG